MNGFHIDNKISDELLFGCVIGVLVVSLFLSAGALLWYGLF